MTLEGDSGPGQWIGDAIHGVTDFVSGVGNMLSKIDPGPAIGNIGAQLDKGVRDVVPGGWATLGVAALAVAAPYLAPYLAEAAPALEVAEGSALTGTGAGTLATAEGGTGVLGSVVPSVAAPIGTTAGTSVGLGAGSGALSSGVAGMGSTFGTGLTYGGLGAGPASVLSGLVGGAGTGSLYGGGLGTVNSLIRGTDPLKGALTGAIMGGLTGASLSGINQTLGQYGITNPTLSNALLSTAKGIASGANPATILGNTALNSGLSFMGNQASSGLTSQGFDPNLAKILASAGTGAAKAGATGGDILTGAETGAAGSALGLGVNAGINAGKGFLAAPMDSAGPATVHDYSTPIPNGTVSLAGIGQPVSTDIGSQYLKNQSDAISADLAKYYPTLAEQQATLADTATKTNDAYAQYQTDKTALADVISKTGYDAARNNVQTLGNTAQELYKQYTPLKEQYDVAVKTYTDSGNTDRTAYDQANNYASQLNTVIPKFNDAYTAYDTANQDLTKLYQTTIEPVYTAFQNSSDVYKTALTNYSSNETNLAKTADIISGDLTALNTVAQGNLATNWAPGEAKLSAPSATADSYYSQLTNAFANPDQPSTTGSQTAGVTVEQIGQPTMTDVGGGTTTPYVPTIPTVEAFPDNNSPTGYSDNDGNPVNADGTPYGDTTSNEVSPIDIIANLPTDNVPKSDTSSTPSPINTGTTGGLPATNTGATDLANLPVAPPATGGGTAPTGGNLPSTTDIGTSPTSGNLPSTTEIGTSPTGTGTTAGTGTGTTAGTGTGTTAGTGTGTTAGTGTGTTAGTSTGAGAAAAGLTAAGLASALYGMGGGNSASSGLTSIPEAPKGTFVKGSQIASPLGSFNVPTVTYATPAPDPNALAEIENAATGGIMHLAGGGSSNEDDLSLKPVLMRGKQAQHSNLFGLGGIPLYPIVGKAEGGAISQGFNPQFYSEGGLGSMQNTHVRGPGTGTSDSIPAMLSDGEFVIPADVVASLGNGSNDSGAKMLDSFLKTIRAHKQKHDAKHLPSDSKGPLGYLLEAKRKVKK
jgi:hypothetical protein